MGWIDRLRGAISRKDSAVGGMISVRRLGQAAWTPRNYRGFAREGYTQNVIAYRCIRLLAENVAAIRFLVMENGREMESHPLLQVLSRPNPWQSGDELIDSLVSYFKISGNAFLEAVSLDGKVRELYALRPDRMSAIAGRRGYPQAWSYSVDGTLKHSYEMDLPPGAQLPIMHLREFNPLDDWGGQSPVEAAAFAIDVHNAAGRFNKALLDNSAAPSGALVYSGGEDGEGTLPADQFARLKSELEENYSGPRNAGKPLLLEGGLDWKPMGLSPKDMEFVTGKREAAREIALAFGVPPMLLGIPGDNTYSNYREANAAFHRQSILPLADKICEALSNWLEPTYGPIKIGYDEDAISALSVEREAVWSRVSGADFITTDEKRAATGYGEYVPSDQPGGSILVGGTLVPLDEVSFSPGGPEPTNAE